MSEGGRMHLEGVFVYTFEKDTAKALWVQWHAKGTV